VTPEQPMRVGAIDIGSNSIRLLVAELVDPGAPDSGLVTVARAGEVCRLGRGLDRTGVIEPKLAERAGVLAAEFLRRARNLGAAHVVIGATAALRRATNGAEVAGIISARAGAPVRILTGDEEARLVYRSVVSGLGAGAMRSPCVVFDLGGGSTEVVSGMGEESGRWVSLPFGAVSLTERHLASDPPSAGEIEALRREVRDIIMHECAYMPSRTPLLAGVGGTVTVLASLDRELTTYEPGLIEGWVIRPDRLEALVDRLVGASHEQRLSLSIMGEGRADIVVAGTLVVRELAARFPAPGLMCSTRGLRYGLARLAAEELAGRAGGPP
jgi:exopolyphosphatase/guanosine-5'-triphosphate,3'-diphosphate pyrophosphatase